MRQVTTLLGLALLGLALLASGCGPTDEEIGRAVMLASPLAFGVGLGVTYLLARLWRRVQPGIIIAWRPALIGLGVCGALAVLALIGVTHEPETDPLQSTTDGIPGVLEWFFAALFIWGSAFVALWLLSFRLWLHWEPGRAFGRSWLPPLVFMVWPCPIMAFTGTGQWDEVFVPAWAIIGYVGAVPGGLLLLLLAEILIRRAKQRQPEGA